MTKKQNQFYWQLWGRARKAKPDLDRKELHAQPSANFPAGLPASHLDFEQEHFDEFKARCLALSRPGDYVAQVEQVKMPATRKLTYLRRLLSALDEAESYAVGILGEMNRTGKVAGRLTGLEELPASGVQKIVIALKIVCRRRWPKKADLLRDVEDFWQANELDAAATIAAIRTELNWQDDARLEIERLVYEDLLGVLAVLRRQAVGAPRSAVEALTK